MPPANLHGESTPDFIVRMYIECTFEFIEAILLKVLADLKLTSPTRDLSPKSFMACAENLTKDNLQNENL